MPLNRSAKVSGDAQPRCANCFGIGTFDGEGFSPEGLWLNTALV